ncbi:MAG TPA: amidohydrolase family protein [Xanthobacteraceae bacterium]|nr:amidohydrolase family protein [Xanthobacteraceae bacterium]
MAKTLFKNAYVVSCNTKIGDLPDADVLVEDTRIKQVGAKLDAGGAEVVDASGMLLMPGMIDTHSHLWETPFKGRVAEGWGMEYFTNIHPLVSYFTPEDAYAGIYAGHIESLANGVTTMFDYNTCIHTPEHADAAIQAIKDAGIRGFMGYDFRGKSPNSKPPLGPSDARFPDVKRLRGNISNGSRDLVRLATCLSEISPENVDAAMREIEFSRDLGCIMSWHCNKAGEIEAIATRGLLKNDLVPAHGNYTTDKDLELLAGVGGFLTSQTEAETYAGRRSMSMIARGHRLGVRIAIGVDVPVIGNLGLLPQMRLLHFLQRYMDGVIERHEAQVPVTRRPGVPTLHPRDILEIATINGAAALGIGDVAGQIAPGFEADIVLLDGRNFGIAEGDPAGHIVLNSSSGDVDTVMVAGKFRKRGGKMVGVDLGKMLAARVAARDRVYKAAGEVPGGLHKTYWAWGAGD